MGGTKFLAITIAILMQNHRLEALPLFNPESNKIANKAATGWLKIDANEIVDGNFDSMVCIKFESTKKHFNLFQKIISRFFPIEVERLQNRAQGLPRHYF